MVDSLIYFTLYVAEMMIAYIYFEDWYKKSSSKLITASVYAAGYLIMFAANRIADNLPLNIIMFFAVNVIIAIIVYKAKIMAAVIHSVIMTIAMFMSEVISLLLYTMICRNTISDFEKSYYTVILLGVLSKTAYLIIAKIISFLGNLNTRSNIRRSQILLLIMPVIIFILLSVEVYILRNIEIPLTINITMLVMNLFALLFCVFMFAYSNIIVEHESRYHEAMRERMVTDIDQNYITVLETQYDNMQILAHDMKAHICAMSSMNTIDEVRDYAMKLYPVVEKKASYYFTKNHTLDILINKFYVLCEKSGVKFIVSVIGTNLSYLPSTDIIAIINNLLDNALEAASKTENGIIEMTIRRDNNSFDMLSVVNSCTSPPKKNGKSFISSKENCTNSHGYGIKSIRRYVNKNNGIISSYYDTNENMFHATILFRCGNNNNRRL